MPRRSLLLAAICVFLAPAAARGGPDSDAIRRGEYVAAAAGCFGCHTDVKGKGAAFAGGRALKTPFGTFYGPNITPDRETGIGAWSAEDFRRALRDGVSPSGKSYYPAFPYTSFTRMTDADIDDLWRYLRSTQAAAVETRAHSLKFPYSQRWLMGIWRALYFTPGAFDPETPAPDGVADESVWRRGAYLVRALVHCGECHTPRGDLGSLDADLELAGNAAGPEGDPAPNITPHAATGIGGWSADEIFTYLEIGMNPEGDFAGGAMAEIIENSTGKLSAGDRAAIAAYLLALKPVERKIVKPKR